MGVQREIGFLNGDCMLDLGSRSRRELDEKIVCFCSQVEELKEMQLVT